MSEKSEYLNHLSWDQLELYQVSLFGFHVPRKATHAVFGLVILSIAIPILIFAVITYYSYISHFTKVREGLTRTVEIVREHALTSISSIFSVAAEVDKTLYGLTDKSISAEQINIHRRLKMFTTGVKKIEDIWILNRDGIELVSAAVFPIPANLDLSDRDYYLAQRDCLEKPGTAFVSQVLRGRTRGRIAFVFSWPRKNEIGDFDGVIGIGVEPNSFSEFFATFLNKGASTIALVRDDGAVLAQSPGRQEDLLGLKIAPNILEGIRKSQGDGFFETAVNADGSQLPYLVAYGKVPGTPIYVVANFEKNTIVAEWKNDLIKMLSFGGPLMLGLWGFGAVAYRVTRIRDEVEERFEQFAEHSSAAIWTMNAAEMRFDYLSPAFETVWGLSRQEVIDHPRKWGRRLHPEDRHRVLRAMAQLGSGRFYTMEYRIVEPLTGSLKWIRDIGFPIANGRIGGITIDVTEKRMTDDQIRLLSQEVTHRAKNMLAVVQSIARQTAAKSEPAVFAEEFTKRIAGLAASLDLVVKSGWHGVDFGQIVAAQLALFLDLKGSQVSISGPALVIRASAAQALGMALHELATNSIKHGALSTAFGHISIEWQVKKDEGRGQFDMKWTETGGPKPKAPTYSGFGYAVMVKAAEHSLNAHVELQYPSSGLVWHLTAPLEGVLFNPRGSQKDTGPAMMNG